MDEVTRTLIDATDRLDQSAAALDVAFADTYALQAKYDAAMRKMTDLIKAREQNWDATARSALASLAGRQGVNRRALEKQQQQLNKARQTYELHSDSLSRLTELYADQLTALRVSTTQRERRERGLIRCFERFILRELHKVEAPGDETFDHPEGSHSYIIMDASRFLNLMIELDTYLTCDSDFAMASSRYRPVKFLEVGSGPGRNMVLAKNSELLLIDTIAGFDIDDVNIEKGKLAFGFDDASLFVEDALEADYGDWDVVYAFRPFSDLELQSVFEERVCRTMRKGAYFICAYSWDMERHTEMRRMGDQSEIWKKVADSPA